MSVLTRLSLLFVLSLSVPLMAEEASIPIKSGETIAFLGDSITAAGAKPGGYCRLVIDGLKQEGIEVKGVFAGVSGHKSNQMLKRLDKDVISKKPNWMTLSCGVNDVWHGKRGVNLEDYKVNIEKIIDKAQAAGIKVMVLTSTMIKEDQSNDLNQKLLGYNQFLREIAKEKGCLLADLNQEMQDALKTFPEDAPKGKQLTGDGVHMNPYGNFMMAGGILKAFGISEDKIKEFEKGWKSIPGSKRMRINVNMSLAEYEKIMEKTGKDPQEVFNEAIKAKKEELLKQE
jgi:lysophospholipase L1-like esterase